MNTCNIACDVVASRVFCAQHYCSAAPRFVYTKHPHIHTRRQLTQSVYSTYTQCVVRDNIIMASLIWFLLLLLWYDNARSVVTIMQCTRTVVASGICGEEMHGANMFTCFSALYSCCCCVYVVRTNGLQPRSLRLAKEGAQNDAPFDAATTPNPPPIHPPSTHLHHTYTIRVCRSIAHVIAIIKMLCWRRVKCAWWPYHRIYTRNETLYSSHAHRAYILWTNKISRFAIKLIWPPFLLLETRFLCTVGALSRARPQQVCKL